MRHGPLTVLTATLCLALLVIPAQAELSGSGGLLARFDGDISPRALPRDRLAPIAVRIDATVRAPAGRTPPALRLFRIALARGGHLDTRGLPTCRRAQVASTSPSAALAACGDALVGAGGIVARTVQDGRPGSTQRGELLLFNAGSHGHPLILAHLFRSDPPVTDLFAFHIQRTTGSFATLATARLPRSLSRNGYLSSVFLTLRRTFLYRHHRHSYLSAACRTPPGIPIASFPFARTTLGFADGRTLSATLVRTCRVRR